MIKPVSEKIAEGIQKFYTGFKSLRILKTSEEVVANTNPDNLPSAVVVSELYNKLNGCSFEREGNDFYIVGADAVRKKLGATITKIHTTQQKEGGFGTVNVKNIANDYKNLTTENFFIVPVSGYSVNGGYWTGIGNYWSSAMDKSYDNETGVFSYKGLYTAQTTASAGGLICDIFLVE